MKESIYCVKWRKAYYCEWVNEFFSNVTDAKMFYEQCKSEMFQCRLIEFVELESWCA